MLLDGGKCFWNFSGLNLHCETEGAALNLHEWRRSCSASVANVIFLTGAADGPRYRYHSQTSAVLQQTNVHVSRSSRSRSTLQRVNSLNGTLLPRLEILLTLGLVRSIYLPLDRFPSKKESSASHLHRGGRSFLSYSKRIQRRGTSPLLL